MIGKKHIEKQDKHTTYEKDVSRPTTSENVDNKHPLLQSRASLALGPPPERPPRPVIPQDPIKAEPETVSVSSNHREKSGGTGMSILRALGLHSSSSHEDIGTKSQHSSTRAPHDGTQSLDRTAKWKQPYVNIPNVLETGDVDDKLSEPVKMVSPIRGSADVAPLAEPDDLDNCTGPPPERPEKYDRAKVVPPGRPEKSDRLRALIESQDNKSSKNVPVSKKGNETSHGSVKEKPARPPYLPTTAVKADPLKSNVDVEKNVAKDAAFPNIYPTLSELGDVKLPDSVAARKLLNH